MAEGGFNELELLSQEDLMVDTLRHLLRAYAEFRRREDVTRVFLESFSGFSIETKVWFRLYQGKGAQRFNDICHNVGCSPTTLIKVLNVLNRKNLVRKVGKKYQAISPAWF